MATSSHSVGLKGHQHGLVGDPKHYDECKKSVGFVGSKSFSHSSDSQSSEEQEKTVNVRNSDGAIVNLRSQRGISSGIMSKITSLNLEAVKRTSESPQLSSRVRSTKKANPLIRSSSSTSISSICITPRTPGKGGDPGCNFPRMNCLFNATPPTPRGRVNLHSLPYVEERKEKTWNAFLKVKLEDALQDLPPISEAELSKKIDKICRSHILSEPLMSPGSFHKSKNKSANLTPRARDLLSQIRASKELFQPLIERVQVLDNTLQNFLKQHQKKTPWCEILAKDFRDILERFSSQSSDGNTLEAFLKLRKSKKERPLFKQIVGGGKVAKTLIRLSSNESIGELKHKIRVCDSENELFNQINSKQFIWADSEVNSLNRISLRDVVRSINPDGHPLHDIRVNGKPLYYISEDPTTHTAERLPKNKKEAQFEYFRRLIKSIFEEGLSLNQNTPSEEDLHERVEMLLNFNPFPRIHSYESTYEDIMRICTINAWSHAHFLAGRLFPNLIHGPYACMQGGTLRSWVTITGKQAFGVKLRQQYNVFPRLKVSNWADKDRNLGQISFEFVVFPKIVENELSWSGYLYIQELHLPDATKKEKEAIYTAILRHEEPEDPESLKSKSLDIRSKPNTTRPRSNSSPRV